MDHIFWRFESMLFKYTCILYIVYNNILIFDFDIIIYIFKYRYYIYIYQLFELSNISYIDNFVQIRKYIIKNNSKKPIKSKTSIHTSKYKCNK